MDDRKLDLSRYRMEQATETLEVARECYTNLHYKDSINRSYYAAFYAVKAILALGEVDFKRHKSRLKLLSMLLLKLKNILVGWDGKRGNAYVIFEIISQKG